MFVVSQLSLTPGVTYASVYGYHIHASEGALSLLALLTARKLSCVLPYIVSYAYVTTRRSFLFCLFLSATVTSVCNVSTCDYKPHIFEEPA